MIPATTDACIIASAGLDTLSPATILGLVPSCFSLRRDGDLAGRGLCPPVFGFEALRVVTCQLPDVPLPWELERYARRLTFDVLTGCVGWTELVEGIPVLKFHQCDSISDD